MKKVIILLSCIFLTGCNTSAKNEVANSNNIESSAVSEEETESISEGELDGSLTVCSPK